MRANYVELETKLSVAATTSELGEAVGTGQANAWPLGMFMFGTAVGGWTLTVVGSCILAPLE